MDLTCGGAGINPEPVGPENHLSDSAGVVLDSTLLGLVVIVSTELGREGLGARAAWREGCLGGGGYWGRVG